MLFSTVAQADVVVVNATPGNPTVAACPSGYLVIGWTPFVNQGDNITYNVVNGQVNSQTNPTTVIWNLMSVGSAPMKAICAKVCQ
jgi:hypothetical protein